MNFNTNFVLHFLFAYGIVEFILEFQSNKHFGPKQKGSTVRNKRKAKSNSVHRWVHLQPELSLNKKMEQSLQDNGRFSLVLIVSSFRLFANQLVSIYSLSVI